MVVDGNGDSRWLDRKLRWDWVGWEVVVGIGQADDGSNGVSCGE